jgi:hypothetical protein
MFSECEGNRYVRNARDVTTMVLKQTFIGVAFATMAMSWCLPAQTSRRDTLETILLQLDKNLIRTDTVMPDLFCEEHTIAEMRPGPSSRNVTTDSILRLKRTYRDGYGISWEESREIFDTGVGVPSRADDNSPVSLEGAFEGAAAVISARQTSCMRYELKHSKSSGRNISYVIGSSSIDASARPSDCIVQEDSSGWAAIDRSAMAITHLEIKTKRHVIRHGNPDIVGRRALIIDYAPVKLLCFRLPTATLPTD